MNSLRHSHLLLAFMVLAAIAAWYLTPRIKIADQQAPMNLEALIPAQFGEWQQDTTGSLSVVDPGQKAAMAKIYNQTLARTYINPKGYKIMLSIAYGNNQRDALEFHKPEICYAAQGFIVYDKKEGLINFKQRDIPITHVSTAMGMRKEPVTYWAMVGDKVVTGGLSKKLAEINYGLVGKIPDGILIRISSLDADVAQAYLQQQNFAVQMLTALPPEERLKLSGRGPLTEVVNH